ncbi:hypothetical protein HK100_009476 [Physocladia obscura]|uniref:BD-FAE-like domain-containing protein n=1 Tax=Physocladia obscura TaxID=109957 RepID=A0AAD5XHL6_9FUNG|nr:hypothetical protein HK100_009476 [Physocladia obscura]
MPQIEAKLAAPTLLTYRIDDSRPVQLDFYAPTSYDPSANKYKTLVYFHGGGLVFGNRKSFLPVEFLSRVSSAGWIIISADYHLLPESNLDDIRADVSALQQWILKNHTTHGIDLSRVSVAGSSAGAFVSIILLSSWTQIKTRAFANFFGAVDFTNEVSRVGASHVGPFRASEILENEDIYKKYVDASTMGPKVWDDSSSAWDLKNRIGLSMWTILNGTLINLINGDFNVSPNPEKIFNPSSLVTADFPPTISVHGDADTLVPIEGSYALGRAYERVGVTHVMVSVPGAEHGLRPEADRIELWERVVLFLQENSE